MLETNTPMLGERGSAFQSLSDSQWPYQSMYTEDAQLLRHWERSDTILVPGAPRLITANLRNLSEYLTLNDVSVKAWSFYSGDLPGAEMMLHPAHELDAVFELAEAPSFDELAPEREAKLELNGLRKDGMIDSFYSVLNAGLHEVYLVDDWPRLESEFEARKAAGLLVSEFADLSALLAINRIALFAGLPNGDGATWLAKFDSYRAYQVPLQEFDGVRMSKSKRL